MAAPGFIIALLFAACFSLATVLEGWHQSSAAAENRSAGLLSAVMGDSRRMFANHFFAKADVYFHSGYYPSIFDGPKPAETHMEAAQDTDEDHEEACSHENCEHDEHEHDENCDHGEEEGDFFGKPKDWIDRFGRNFYVSEHTHLQSGQERELLPWLRLSAALDPQKVQTYTVASYWLRTKLGKVKEAEQFLRDGLRENPDSYELLFELGRIRADHYNDPAGARNLWELGLAKWRQQKAAGKEPDEFVLQQLLAMLGTLEEQQGRLPQAVHYFEQLKEVSPAKDEIQKRIDGLRAGLPSSQ